MATRGRTPTPAEAALLTVYQDAEQALLGAVTSEVRDLVDAPDDDLDARRALAARRIRETAQGVFLGLERGTRARVDAVIGAAAEQGAAAAAAELGTITGQGRDQYADTINRGALDRLAAAVIDRLSPVHSAILRTTLDAFRDVAARILPALVVGTDTRREATQRALWSLTDRGITGFTDRAGRNWSLSAYAEMAARTGAARAHVDGQLDRLAAAGRDLVIVNGSGDRCEQCRAWSGAILSNGGQAGPLRVEHATRDGEYITVHVAGTVDDARAAGLLHPQCRCSLRTYTPGITRDEPEPPADTGQYAARQQQRAIERQIRRHKAREAAALDPAALKRAQAGTRGAQARMRDHLAGNPDLIRRRYREQPGTGNLPTDGLRERVGPGGNPLRTDPVKGRARKPRDMSDVELDREMQAALAAEDFDAFDRYATETDRRDAKRQTDRDRRAAAADRLEEERGLEMERRMALGDDEEEAVADVYGVPVDRQRRQRAISDLRRDGYEGRSFDELARASYRDEVYRRVIDAENATRGTLLSKAGQAAGMDGLSLFTGSEARARKWASDELKAWWDAHGRLTLEQWKAQRLGDPGAAGRSAAARGDFLT